MECTSDGRFCYRSVTLLYCDALLSGKRNKRLETDRYSVTGGNDRTVYLQNGDNFPGQTANVLYEKQSPQKVTKYAENPCGTGIDCGMIVEIYMREDSFGDGQQ